MTHYSMGQGMIGAWAPGIGDPSPGGWLVFVLYFLGSLAVWRLLRDHSRIFTWSANPERRFWQLLLVGLFLLGINKQLDLQTALTEVGRMLAERQGWYAERRQVQAAFIAGLGITGLALLVAALCLIWNAPASTYVALLGCAGLVLFVLMRAALFHHVAALPGHSLSWQGVHWLEMGALLVIMACAVRRRGTQ